MEGVGMKHWFLIVPLCFALSGTANALDLTVGYDKYLAPNKGNNYDDGQGYTVGLGHDIYKDLSGRLEFSHLTDIHFPTASDPKGSFGELRSFAALYSLIFAIPYNKNVSFDISAGVGPAWWDFRENPLWQDGGIKASVSPSFVMKAGVGADIKIYDDWKIRLYGGWMDTSIGKKVVDPSGQELVALDAGSELNLRYRTLRIEIKKEY